MHDVNSPSQNQIQDMVDTAMVNFIKQSMQNIGMEQADNDDAAERAIKDSPRLKRALTFDPGHLPTNQQQKKLLDDSEQL